MGEKLKSKEPKSLLDVFKFCALGFAIIIFIVNGIENYRNNMREKNYTMKNVLILADLNYNYATEQIEAWLKVDEKYMPHRDKLNTYFKDEIKVEQKLYSDENTTIYLDNIKGNDNNFLRFNFKKEDKVEIDKGELVTIRKETNYYGDIDFSTYDVVAEVYDRDNKMIETSSIYEESYENENFMLSVKKDILTKSNWPIGFKLNLTKVSYERKK